MLPSGRDNEERGEEVNEEEVGEIEYWSEEELGEEWEQWEFVEEDDVEEDQEYEEDEEEEEDEENDNEEEREEEEGKEEEKGEEKVPVFPLTLCYQTTQCQLHSWRLRTPSLLFRMRFKVEKWKERCPVCRKKIQLVINFFFSDS